MKRKIELCTEADYNEALTGFEYGIMNAGGWFFDGVDKRSWEEVKSAVFQAALRRYREDGEGVIFLLGVETAMKLRNHQIISAYAELKYESGVDVGWPLLDRNPEFTMR